MNNFSYLDGISEFSELKGYCHDCESLVLSYPELSAVSARKALEYIIKFIYKAKYGNLPVTATLFELINSSEVSNFIGDQVIKDSLHYIRILGNNAAHNEKVKKTEALLCLENLHFFVGEILVALGAIADYPSFDKEYLQKTAEEKQITPVSVDCDDIAVAKYAVSIGDNSLNVQAPVYMSEANTRKIYIDLYLREAGWCIATQENIVVPGKAGVEIKVEGMPNSEGIGFCDYVLYGRDGKPLAIVEAKKTSVSPEKGRHQVNLYGECMKAKFGYVPVLYYTNGYTIKVIDGLYPDRDLMSFHTIKELELMIQRRSRGDISDLKINDDITNRPYQKIAITNICERLNAKQRRGLLVMATGTGKTRVAISLVDVLTRNKWVKNVLFLADRTALVDQAKRNFVKLLPNMNYCVLSGGGDRDMNARLMFSTYQTMINFIDGEDKKFPSGRFDLIIIDEAHRSIFNKYGSIFNYFDSLLIGLTATPKSDIDKNTYDIFDCESGIPSFDYSLDEAVKDHYLVNYRDVRRISRVLQHGITYSELSETDKDKYEAAFGDDAPDLIGNNDIFRKVYNKDTCDKVIEEVMTYGLKVDEGEKIGKTIIFAYNHKHALMIVERFHKMYPQLGANFCQLVDNYVNYADDLICKFEADPNFQIAVSVDMLDTGVDIPSVVNLVFFKPVKSKIKFIQMIGRGTRLCPNLFGNGKDKRFFLTFDYCGNFTYFEQNPEGSDGSKVKSITERLFEVRLDILQELQRIEHQENEYKKQYYTQLKGMLYGDILKIKDNSTRIAVRLEMPYVDKYSDENSWVCISPVMGLEIKHHLVHLLDCDALACDLAKAFDAQMLAVELSVLEQGDTGRARKQVAKIREVAQYLLVHKASIPQVFAKKESLATLKSEQLWLSPDVEKLEKLRMEIRDIMQFLKDGNSPSVSVDYEDEMSAEDGEGGLLIDIRTYREKVLDYLLANMDSDVLKKIKNIEPITEQDLGILEKILWEELGTKDEYREVADTDNLAAFVRSLIGLDQDAINTKFGEFLNGNVLNSRQQEFVQAIINYVRENGDIEKADLLEKSPFDNYDLASLFGDQLGVLVQIVNIMHNAVAVAA